MQPSLRNHHIAELLATIREELHVRLKEMAEEDVPRHTQDMSLLLTSKKIPVIIGMRRTGKTWFLLQVIKFLLQQKSPGSVFADQILYLNFEDDRLTPMNAKKLSAWVDTFFSLHPENHDRTCHLFFDEIQNVAGWERFVRRLIDTKNVRIYLTGSSAKLLSKEIASELRGRSLAIEMWPFSFYEYLQANNIHKPETFGKITRDKLKPHLIKYLQHGGFPETLHTEESERTQILQNYADVVIFRDIVERYGITNVELIRYLFKFLASNAGNTFSVNKIFNDLKSQGFQLSKNTIHEYLAHIEDAYFAFSIPLYSSSIRKSRTNPRKIYLIDPAMHSAMSFVLQQNKGHLFENLIFLDLKRQRHEIYYYKTQEGYEVDFFSRAPNGKTYLYQVVWDITDAETLEREERALKSAEKELGVKGRIITPDEYFEWSSGVD